MSAYTSRAGRRGAVSMSAVGVIAFAAALMAAGVIVGTMISRRSQPPTPTPAAVGTDSAALNSGTVNVGTRQPAPAPSVTAPPAPTIPPPVRLEPPVVDLGVIKPGQSFGREVQIINTSASPLTITYSRPSCTCTSVDLANTVIPAGGSVPLQVRYDSQLTLGPKSSLVRIAFDGYDEIVSVQIRAEVALAVKSEPAYIRATEVNQGVVVISSLDGKPFRIKAVNGEPPDIIDFDPASDQALSRYRVRWDLRRYDPTTCLDPDGNEVPEYLAVETDHPECPIFDIYVRHHCTVPSLPTGGRNWVPSERHALVGALAPGESSEFSIAIKWLRGAAPDDTIESVSSATPEFDAELVEVKQNADLIECVIRITPQDDHRGLFYGPIWIHATRTSGPMTIIGTVLAPDEDGPAPAETSG